MNITFFDNRSVLFGLLEAKLCRTIMKLHQKLNFDIEVCENGPKVGNMGPYVHTWASMDPYGPGPGPWRVGKVQEKMFFKHIFVENRRFDGFVIQTAFSDGFKVLLSFLAERWYRTIMSSPQKANSRTKTCSYGKKYEVCTCKCEF